MLGGSKKHVFQGKNQDVTLVSEDEEVSHPLAMWGVECQHPGSGGRCQGMMGNPPHTRSLSSSSGACMQASPVQREPEIPTWDVSKGLVDYFRAVISRVIDCLQGKKDFAKPSYVNSVGPCPKGTVRFMSISVWSINSVTVHLDSLIQRKSTYHQCGDKDIHLFPWITSALLFILAGSLYITHSPLLSKSIKEKKDSWEKAKNRILS